MFFNLQAIAAGSTVPRQLAVVVSFSSSSVGFVQTNAWQTDDRRSKVSRFNPERFLSNAEVKSRHPYSWVPFSGGAHMCIGLHFAEMQIKLVLRELVLRYRFSVPEGYEMPIQQSPISKPRDGLPIELVRRA